MGEVLQAAFGGGYSHVLQSFHRPGNHRFSGRMLVNPQRFYELVSDGKYWIKGRLRVLQDHGDFAAPYLPHFFVRLGYEVLPVQNDLS